MLGKQIKKMRIAKDITRYKMGKITKLHPDTIVSVEEDDKGTIGSLKTMASALGVEITFKPKTK